MCHAALAAKAAPEHDEVMEIVTKQILKTIRRKSFPV